MLLKYKVSVPELLRFSIKASEMPVAADLEWQYADPACKAGDEFPEARPNSGDTLNYWFGHVRDHLINHNERHPLESEPLLYVWNATGRDLRTGRELVGRVRLYANWDNRAACRALAERSPAFVARDVNQAIKDYETGFAL